MAVVKITGLKSSTKYSYVVYAKFADGTRTETSRAITFTTPKSAKPSTIRDEFIQLGGGSIFAGNVNINTGLLTGAGVSFNQNGILGQFTDGSQSFLLEAATGNAYFSGSVVAAAGQIGGFIIGPTSLSATNIVLSSTNGFILGSASQFTVNQNGDLRATNASITGNINATSGSFTGAINAASMYGGYLNINGNASITGYIVADSGSFNGGLYASAGNIGNWNITASGLNTGSVGLFASSVYNSNEIAIFAGSAINNRATAPFRVTYSGNMIAQNASITGNIVANSGSFLGAITASVGNIGGFTLQSNSLSAQNITISSTAGLNYGPDKFKVDNLGNASALSLYASSGLITGDFQVTGAIYGGAKYGVGDGVQIDSTGIYGYNGSSYRFKLPTDALTDPLITKFQIIEAQYTGSGSRAVFVIGSPATGQSNITINGDKVTNLNKPAEIKSVVNGTPTSSATGTGFYFDDAGRFRLASDANNYISGSSGNLFVTGTIVATSGSFTGTIYAQSGSFTGAINSTASIIGGVVKTSNPGVALYGGNRNYIGFTDNNGVDKGFITTGYVPYLGTNAGVVISGAYDTTNSAPSYPYIAVGARSYDYKSIFLSSASSGNIFISYSDKYSELYLSSDGYGGLQDENGNAIYTAWDRIYISGGKTSVTASVMINSGYVPGTGAPSSYNNGGPVYINQTGSATTFIHSELAASAGLTTTNHPLQIGSNSSRNLRIDSNGIQAVNNSAVGSLFINKSGGSVTFGNPAYFSTIRTAGRTTSVTEKIEGFFATDSYSSLIRDINGLNASAVPLYLGVYNSGGAISGTTMITRFLVEGSHVGSINVNSTGTTPAFAGFSDYRLKENINDFNFASDIIKKIKLRSFKWKNNNTYDVGFIAHELQDASLDLAMGNKDDVDENGNPIYQSTMPARLIPYLTGALKDAILKIEELEQRIAALENK